MSSDSTKGEHSSRIQQKSDPQQVSYLSGRGQALHKGRSDVACQDPAHQRGQQTPVTVVAQSILHQGEHVEQREAAFKKQNQ